jgi:hypothetical protein
VCLFVLAFSLLIIILIFHCRRQHTSSSSTSPSTSSLIDHHLLLHDGTVRSISRQILRLTMPCLLVSLFVRFFFFDLLFAINFDLRTFVFLQYKTKARRWRYDRSSSIEFENKDDFLMNFHFSRMQLNLPWIDFCTTVIRFVLRIAIFVKRENLSIFYVYYIRAYLERRQITRKLE